RHESSSSEQGRGTTALCRPYPLVRQPLTRRSDQFGGNCRTHRTARRKLSAGEPSVRQGVSLSDIEGVVRVVQMDRTRTTAPTTSLDRDAGEVHRAERGDLDVGDLLVPTRDDLAVPHRDD